ncbi:MAG: efflux RND transporter periplasmic adaptor subunit [Polyangiaceae bacterium]
MDRDEAVNEEMDPGVSPPPAEPRPSPVARPWRVPVLLGAVVAALLASGGMLYLRAASAANHVALASSPKGVTATRARASKFRSFRRYVATVDPWLRAAVGPQLVSAYVETVLVRPGDAVKRGDVIATIDCRHTSAADQAVAASAQALDAKRAALAKESDRIASLLDGGYVARNEVDQKAAEVASMAAQVAATRAQLAGRSIEVNDCVLRAPFDGEVAERLVDPGAFVRPGQPIAVVVDRGTVRISVEVPETDFDVVPPGTEVAARLLATGKTIRAKVSRRAPSADGSTRTVHVEMDVPDPERAIPVGTSADLRVDVGEPRDVTEIPLVAASVKGSKATVCVVDSGLARFVTAQLVGERDGSLFVDGKVAPGALVVTEGRAMLNEGDHVTALEGFAPAPAPEAPAGSASASAAPTAEAPR